MRANTLKLAIALFGVLFAVALPARAFETKPFDAAAFKAAQDAGTPILVDVFAPWCPTCKAQQQVFDTLKAKPEFDKLTVFKVDFDNQKDAVKSFGARMQSTLIAFKGATETGRSAGDTNAKSIEALMKTTLE
jgi:thiol-disulfide isomerase/thioredoxin